MRSAGAVLHALMWADSWLALWGAATEAPCAICRGVCLITAAFHHALAGDKDTANRDGKILRGANELRDLREELNRARAMMMNNVAVLTTTFAGPSASEATVLALDTP
eukprot:5344124-Pyramimonas_sp.AAC.1